MATEDCDLCFTDRSYKLALPVKIEVFGRKFKIDELPLNLFTIDMSLCIKFLQAI